MDVKTAYKESLVWPGIIVLVLCAFYVPIMWFFYRGGYELYEEFAIWEMAALVYSLLISGLSLGIFLNLYDRIRNHRTLSFLSWFFLPFGFMCMVLGMTISELRDVGSLWGLSIVLLANLPFAIGLIRTYRKFKKHQKASGDVAK